MIVSVNLQSTESQSNFQSLLRMKNISHLYLIIENLLTTDMKIIFIEIQTNRLAVKNR